MYIVQNALRRDMAAEIGLLSLSVQLFPCPAVIIKLYVSVKYIYMFISVTTVATVILLTNLAEFNEDF